MSAVAAQAREDVNRAVYHSQGVQRYYLSKVLSPPEIACLLKYQPHFFRRDVLDLGVGAGRTAHYLAPLARRYEAVDYSPVMVAYLRKAMPHIQVHQADFSDLSMIANHSFDFVFAPDNAIDSLSHEKRLRALAEISRVLRPGGILAFSSHNLHYRRAFSGPWLDWSSNPARLGRNAMRYLLSRWNHARIGAMRRTTAEYAILNDRGHYYACLHYYAAQSTVRAQLAAHGLRFIEAFDMDGHAISQAEDDARHASLFYTAEAEPRCELGYPENAKMAFNSGNPE